MNQLLSAEFVRLRKSAVFWLGILFSTGLGVFSVIMRYVDVRKNADLYDQLEAAASNADGLLFIGGLYLIFAIAVFVGVFVGTEYSDGTIRNKLIAGHMRSSIYFSKLVVCVTAALIMHFLYILVVLVLGGWLLGTTMSVTEILVFTLAGAAALAALTVLLLLCSMLIQSKAAGSIVCLLTVIVMFFSTMGIYMKLNAPEYYDAYEYVDHRGETIRVDKEKNPAYLTGTKRKVYEFLNDFFPSSQLYQVGMNLSEDLDLLVLYDFCIIVISVGAGVVIFQKRNIK